MKINKNDITRSLPDNGVNEEFSIGPALLVRQRTRRSGRSRKWSNRKLQTF